MEPNNNNLSEYSELPDYFLEAFRQFCMDNNLEVSPDNMQVMMGAPSSEVMAFNMVFHMSKMSQLDSNFIVDEVDEFMFDSMSLYAKSQKKIKDN